MKMMEKQIAYCGLNCKTCPLAVAKVTDDDVLRKKTLKEWVELYSEYMGGVTLKVEDMNCSGCRAGTDMFAGCEHCVIRKCCHEKQLGTCADCDNYHTCDMLNGFLSVPAHETAKQNLEQLRMNR